MIDIYNISLLDILPPNLKEDPDVIAASKAIDSEFLLVVNQANQCILLPRIDELDSDVVDLLAWQRHVDFYDSTLPLDTRRELVKNSVRWHMIKGTPAAVLEAAQTVFGNTKIYEWFQYGGQPYYFKMDVDVSKMGASSSNLTLLDRLINGYKNKRSWLELINIFLTSYGSTYFGGMTLTGEAITVYPWRIQEIESSGKVTIPMKMTNTVENIMVYPKKES